MPTFPFSGLGLSASETSAVLGVTAVADDLDYGYPRPNQTVAKPARRGGNVRIAPKAKAKRLLRRGAISKDAAERHVPDLVIMIGRAQARLGGNMI